MKHPTTMSSQAGLNEGFPPSRGDIRVRICTVDDFKKNPDEISDLRDQPGYKAGYQPGYRGVSTVMGGPQK